MPPQAQSSIRPLPTELQFGIKSSIAISSLNDVVIGLLENALDARPENVEFEIDFQRGHCTVRDDGCGIPAQEFGEDGHLGQLHCTSKDASSGSLGRYGRFLSYLGVLSILTITSSCADHLQEYSLTLHRGKVISRTLNAAKEHGTDHTSHRTSVVVRNLFGDIPVRLKQRIARFQDSTEIEKAFRELTLSVVSLLLSCPYRPNLRMDERATKLRYRYSSPASQQDLLSVSLARNHICAALISAALIDQGDVQFWKTASLRTSEISLRAFISLQASPSKRCQFISIGHRPVQNSHGSNLFFQEINKEFEMSTFGAHEDEPNPVGRREMRPVKDRAGRIDRWPMFYIRLDSRLSDISTYLDADTAGESDTHKTHHVGEVLNLMKSLVNQFLQTYQFRPRAHRTQLGESDLPFRSTSKRLKSATTAQQALSASWNGLHAHSFATWSRMKSSNHAGIANLLEGLPKRGIRPPVDYDDGLADDDLLSLVDQVDNACDQTHASELLPNARPGDHSTDGVEERASEQNQTSVLWRDPATGADVLVDTRTGQTIPEHLLTSTSTNLFSNALSASASAVRKRISRTDYGHTENMNTSRIEACLGGEQTTHFSKGEEAIPSIVFGDGCSNGRLSSRPIHKPPLRVPDSSTRDTKSGTLDKRLSKTALVDAVVLGQVDQKFILVRMAPHPSNMIVLIDQHAADERIKVEELYQRLCNGEAATLTKPIVFEVSQEEVAMLRKSQAYFASWSITYEIRDAAQLKGPPARPARNRPSSAPASQQIIISVLPDLISERCRLEPRLLIDILRREIWSDSPASRLATTNNHNDGIQRNHWVNRIHYCPAGLVEMIHSRACRSAIMFNDILTMEQCRVLVDKLGECALPFQCAHGRPSMTLVMDLVTILQSSGSDDHAFGGVGKDELSFGRAFDNWVRR